LNLNFVALTMEVKLMGDEFEVSDVLETASELLTSSQTLAYASIRIVDKVSTEDWMRDRAIAFTFPIRFRM